MCCVRRYVAIITSNNSNKNNLLTYIFSSQKLQKSEQEDFAGNYFKPKRATELLIRAKEDAGRAVSKWAGELWVYGFISI